MFLILMNLKKFQEKYYPTEYEGGEEYYEEDVKEIEKQKEIYYEESKK